jgi:hypothetical protein
MKRNLILVVFVMVVFMAATLPVLGSAEEYKVIKNAVKNKNTGGDVTWFRLEVTDKAARKATVKIKIPLSLVEMISDCADEAIDLKTKTKTKVDLKKILQELKKYGPMTLIEVDDEKELVKIWIE